MSREIWDESGTYIVGDCHGDTTASEQIQKGSVANPHHLDRFANVLPVAATVCVGGGDKRLNGLIGHFLLALSSGKNLQNNPLSLLCAQMGKQPTCLAQCTVRGEIGIHVMNTRTTMPEANSMVQRML